MDMTKYNFFDNFKLKRVLTEKYFSGEPLDFGNDLQLFLGETIVEDTYRVWHEQETPRLAMDEPMIKPEYPWEGRMTEMEGGIIYDEDEKLFKTWYTAYPPMQSPELSDWEKNLEAGNCPTLMCYAESEDMLHWRKPMFTHCPLGSIKESNICFTGGSDGIRGGRVFLNADKSDKANKYVLVYIELCGPRLATSPDGRIWKDVPGVNPLIPVNYDTYQNVIYDDDRKKYLLYLRPSIFAKHESQPAEPVCPGLNYRRRITISESDDLVNWTPPRIVQHASEVAEYDQCDHQNTFVIGGTVIGRMGRFFVKKKDDAVDQKKVPWWAFGSDPHRMQFLDSDAPIPDCLTADGKAVFGRSAMTGFPIYSDGKMYFQLDQTTLNENGKRVCSGYICQFDENRIISRRSDEYGGWLLTREFYLRGSEIEINCDVLDGGSITAEILYGAGGNIRGGQYIDDYRIREFDPITEGGFHCKLSWNGTSDISRFKDQAIFIRFHLTNAKLYSMKVNK